MSDQPPLRRASDGVYRVEVDGAIQTVSVAGAPDDVWAFWQGHVYRSTRRSSTPARTATSSRGARVVEAPMPATVVRVLVAVGSPVEPHDPLVILEAMKMELTLRAETKGIVRAVYCRAAELVQAGATLVELEEGE
jgi:3-methylcrotonyl-CoA carboxylase alpha subunit